jgi:hypothetical protein
MITMFLSGILRCSTIDQDFRNRMKNFIVPKIRIPVEGNSFYILNIKELISAR